MGAPHVLGIFAATLLTCAFLGVLLWAAVSDARTRHIPNASVAALALLGLAGNMTPLLGMDLPYVQGLKSCAVVALGVTAAFLAFEAIWRAVSGRGAGLGMGDIKLIGAAALTLGAWILPCVVVACVLASVVETLRGNKAFAFGPYLCTTFAVCFLYLALFT